MDKPSKNKFKVTLLNEDKKSAVPKRKIEPWDKDDDLVKLFLYQCELVKNQLNNPKNHADIAENLNKLAMLSIVLRDEPFLKGGKLGVLNEDFIRKNEYWPMTLRSDELEWIRSERGTKLGRYLKTIKNQLGREIFIKRKPDGDLLQQLIGLVLDELHAFPKKTDEPYEHGNTKSQNYWAKRITDWLENRKTYQPILNDKSDADATHRSVVFDYYEGRYKSLEQEIAEGSYMLYGKTPYVMIDEIPWTSKLHERSPLIFSILYQAIYINRGKPKSPIPDFESLKLSDKKTDGQIKLIIDPRIRMRLDGIYKR